MLKIMRANTVTVIFSDSETVKFAKVFSKGPQSPQSDSV